MKKFRPFPSLLLCALAAPLLAQAPPPFSAGVSVAPATPPPGAPATTVTTVTTQVTPATPAPSVPPVPARAGISAAQGGVMLNFQNASLNDVLTYLSEAAGFVVVQEAPVQGTVNIVSRQALSPEEAVDLLNTVLIDKGYTALRNGRILKIVTRSAALKHPDLPVNAGSDPALIPRRDAVVTQILPLRFGEAAKLVENLRPLLADTATVSANEASNAIILTDTQTNIRRIATIIQALDTSVASISTITVFALKFADAKEVAQIITQLFASPATQQQNQQGGGRRGGFGGFGGFNFGGGGPGGAPQGGAGSSEARSAASRVVAVADEQSNSVITSSPEDLVPTIRAMINQIDTSITDVTDTRIFRLQNADAVETATIINSLYGDTAGTQSNNGQRNGRNGNNQQQRGFGFPFGGQAQPAGNQQSDRSLLQSKVTAVGDPRTNSLLVTAAQESMAKIAELVGRLDATTAKKQHVYTHALQYGDPDNLANVLRGMLGQQQTTTQVNRLTERQNTGASAESTDISGSGLGGSNNRSTR